MSLTLLLVAGVIIGKVVRGLHSLLFNLFVLPLSLVSYCLMKLQPFILVKVLLTTTIVHGCSTGILIFFVNGLLELRSMIYLKSCTFLVKFLKEIITPESVGAPYSNLCFTCALSSNSIKLLLMLNNMLIVKEIFLEILGILRLWRKVFKLDI